MEATSNILTLLKQYSSKQRSAVIEFGEFADFVRRYAQHHVNEKAELASYLGSTDDALEEELEHISADHQVVLMNREPGKQSIFVVSSFIERYAETYKDIELNVSVPFPNINDIPKNVPNDIVTKVQCSDLLYKLLDKDEPNDKTLYSLMFSKNIPALLFPSSVSVNLLIKLALKKLQDMLRKEEYHDYFLKKLTISNPGKEISIKNFFNLFVARPEDSMDALRTNGENFYNWSQLCYFIKQDYNKLKDFTSEDINILQSISIVEITASFYKSKTAERQQRDNAFKELDTQLENPPYYFSTHDIENMKDSHGKPLLGQYTKEELNEHLSVLRAQSMGNSLPQLLVFKVNGTDGFFILKAKVMQLVIRLCNDARSVIRNSLNQEWFKSLLAFETLPEMKDNVAFEQSLERELKVAEPVLYALLHASFLPVVAFEDSTPGRIVLYRNGALIPYSELLLVSRGEIYSDARIKLPFWYSVPLVSWIISFFKHRGKKRSTADEPDTATEKVMQQEKASAEEKLQKLNAADAGNPRSRKKALRNSAVAAEEKLVPANSSLDRELEAYLSEWNDRLESNVYDNLTQDVNNLIRDYLRKVLRSLRSDSLSPERIASLAQSLEESPSLYKIKNHAALRRYIELYIVKLLKNIPS
ncbi:MAG TPA: hypothetical protein DDW78_01715 [Treponema sp.]|nr:hypothetical protein [Treponema sp.]